MSWLNDLFARKPGGSFLGNLLRQGASILSDGKLGTGAGMITQKQADMRDLSTTEYQQKYGETKSGVKIPGITPDPSIQSASQAWNNAGMQTSTVDTLLPWIKQYAKYIIGIPLALILLSKLNKKYKWL